MESEEQPEPEAPPSFEGGTLAEEPAEPDYFVVEAPRRARASLGSTAIAALAAGFSRRRALAALALLGALVLLVSLLGSAGGSGAPASVPVSQQPRSVARVQAAGPTPASERRAWVENERRALRAQHADEPAVAPAQLAKPGPKPARAASKHAPAPAREPVEADPEPAPAPAPEPEVGYYPPPESPPAPTTPPPAPSPPGGSQEFGIEP